MIEEYSELVTIDELCDILMIGRNTAYKLLNEKRLKAFRIGRVWKISRQSVLDYIVSQGGNKQ